MKIKFPSHFYITTALTFLFSFKAFYFFSQTNLNSGLLKNEKITTYWNNPQKTIRSIGAYNSSGVIAVGEKIGKWMYYNPYGKIEEISHYFLGKKHGEYTSFYPSGKIKFSGFFFLDLPDSSFKAFYKDGTLAEEGYFTINPFVNRKNDTIQLTKLINKTSYFSSIKTKKWNYYYKDGSLLQTSNYKPGDTTEYLLTYYNELKKNTIKEGNGVFETFYNSGKQKKKISYENGVPNGNYFHWNPNGNMRIKGNYKNGKKEGLWMEYFITGQQVYQIINYKNGLKHGEFKEHLKDGKLIIWGNYNNHNKEGKWEYYFENGQLDMVGSFKNDIQHGDWKFYYPNGVLYYNGNFINGLKNGEWNFNYNSGEKWRIGNYKNDFKSGLWTTYYENKQKAMEGEYEKGKENGEWSSWYENGQLKDKGSYKNALMNQSWEGYYKTGQIKYKGDYDLDNKTNKWTYWAHNGKIIETGDYAVLSKNSNIIRNETRIIKKSVKNGVWNTYSEIDGSLKSKENFNDGMKNGKCIYYYPGGVIANQEISYKNGLLNGKFSTYDRRGNIKSETNYKENKKDGDMKVYSKRGKLILHVEYKNGVKTKDVIKKINYKYRSNKTKK